VCKTTFLVAGGEVGNMQTVLSGRLLLFCFFNGNEEFEHTKTSKYATCDIHGEEYATYCLTCDIAICPSCIASHHRKHKLAFLRDGVGQVVETCRGRITQQIDKAAKEFEEFSSSNVRFRHGGGKGGEETDPLIGRNSATRQEMERLSTFMIKLTQMKEIIELISEDTFYQESTRLAIIRHFLQGNADLLEDKQTGSLRCVAVEEINITHGDDCNTHGLKDSTRSTVHHTIFLPSMADSRKEPTTMAWPYNIALLKDGALVARDKISGMIMVYRCRIPRDLTSAYIFCIFKGKREYRLNYPKDVATYEDRIFVLDAKSKRLVVFTTNGEGLGVIPLPGKPGTIAIEDRTAYIGYKGRVEAYEIVETDTQTPRVVLQRKKVFTLPSDSWPWYMEARTRTIAINLKGKALVLIKDDRISPVYDVVSDSADLRGLAFIDDDHIGVVNGKTGRLTSYPIKDGLYIDGATDILGGLDSPSDVVISADGNYIIGQDNGTINVYR
jgi:hypothetical protein